MTPVMHSVERLFYELERFDRYPAGVVPVPARIPGTAFFPGGSGLWNTRPDEPLPPMPIGGVMILGHDFHSESGFRLSLEHGAEFPRKPGSSYRVAPTWHTVLRLLREVNIEEDRCFFTNAYMGLREGNANTGRFPGASDVEFRRRCQDFFLLQLREQRPSLILTLGACVPPFIAPLSPDLESWDGATSLADVDREGPVKRNVTFESVPDLVVSVVALTHPSLRGPNVRRRIFAGRTGHAAELAMIGAAV